MPTVTAPELYFGVPIVKTEKADDGSLLVYGRATDGTLDLDEQIVDPGFARKALREWFEDYANVRQMHSGALPPGGVGLELDEKDDGLWLKSEVYEPGAILQVQKGGYKAYSVGIARPRIVRDAAAPGGRIVDGIVVEVSLVDRPANANCKFALTKGVGKDMEIVAKAVEPSVTKATPSAGREGDFPEGTRFAYTDSKGGKHLPIHDEGHVRVAVGRFGQTNFESGSHKRRAARAILSAAREHGIDVDDDSAVAQAAKKKGANVPKADVTKSDDRMCVGCGHELDHDDKFCSNCGKTVPDESGKAAQPDQRPPMQPGETPYAVRRLHDACCAAYSTDAVKAAYPVLEKNGIGQALGPGARLALWQMLNQEVQEDAGTGTEALDIHHLGEAYKHLGEFISCESGYPVGADGDAPETSLVMLAAHSDLHAAFAELNKDIMPSGGPDVPSAASAGQITPGQFRRPYISAGHQRENGVGAGSPSIPNRTHDMAATDFQRGPLTAGQERQSPGSGKRAPVTAMQDLHDRLALQFPDLCPMDLHPATVPNRDTARPEPKQMGAEPTLTKAEKDAAKAEAKIEKARRKAKGQKALAKAVKPLTKKIAELQATVDELSREPDPNRAAHRGVTTVTKAASPQAQKRAEDDERELREALQAQAQHPDPQTRLRAQDRLAAKGWTPEG